VSAIEAFAFPDFLRVQWHRQWLVRSYFSFCHAEGHSGQIHPLIVHVKKKPMLYCQQIYGFLMCASHRTQLPLLFEAGSLCVADL